MKLLVFVALLGVLVHATPEAGYSYFNLPSTSYEAPGGRGGFGGGGSGGALIQKQIYEHDSTAEPDEVRPQGPIEPAAAPQKHYVIFKKAPTPTTPTTSIIPTLPAEDEQKTLKYVPVKRHDESPEITMQTAASTQPSKRNICFICYKTRKEAGGATGIGNRTRFAREADEGSSGGAAGNGIGSKVNAGHGGAATIPYIPTYTTSTIPPYELTTLPWIKRKITEGPVITVKNE